MKTIVFILAILIAAPLLPAQTNEAVPPALASKPDQAPTARAGALRVAVLDSASTGEASVGLADFIEAGLAKQGVETYDRRSLRVLLAERGLGKSGLMDLDTARLAQLPSVEMFVRGEVRLNGTNDFALTLEAVRAADAVTAVSLSATGKYPRDWLPALERLMREMSGRLQGAPAGDAKTAPGRAITWMPEASLWLFRGLECYAEGDYARAVVAFGDARRWEPHFRLAWLWEARSYQRLGFAAQARRVLEAGRLAEEPVGKALEQPVLAIVAGPGVSAEEQQEFTRRLADSDRVSVLDPRWIGASAREVDLQLTGEMAARSAAHNAWLALDEVVFLERAGATLRARKQDTLTGRVLLRVETSATKDAVAQLSQLFLQKDEIPVSNEARPLSSEATPPRRVALPVNQAKAELARCLDRAARDRTNVQALLAAADACLPWEADVLNYEGHHERGVEWRVREEFLAQAVAAIRQNPGQPDAPFWLASALWRQRYTPEYTIWAGSASGLPLREEMRPLLELFPQSADATNLAEIISENSVHNKRSMPKDPRYLQPPFQPEPSAPTAGGPATKTPDAEAKLNVFSGLVYEGQLDRPWVLFLQLAFGHVPMKHYLEETLINKMLQDQPAHEACLKDLDRIIQTPDVLVETRCTAAYDLALWCHQSGDYFRATELLREVLADEASVDANSSSDTAKQIIQMSENAFALLKHVRLFWDGELDFGQCCGPARDIPADDPAEMDAMEKLYKQYMALTLYMGPPPTAEQMDKRRQDMSGLSNEMVEQHRAALPAFLARKLKETGPTPYLMNLCSRLGPQAEPLLPQIVAAVRQFGNGSTQGNALRALGNIGHPAASALPVVLMALGSDDVVMVQPVAVKARGKLGVAPRRVVPYLARLLYHPDSRVALSAAESLADAAGLPADLRAGLSDDEFVQRSQDWWENTGSWQVWEN